jgi:starvation-inducible DNA-binding protein
MEELYKLLVQSQCSLFGLFQKTWMYHWNIMGPDFYQYHTMLGDQYEKMFEEIDRLTEHMRYLMIKPIAPLSQVADMSSIDEAGDVLTAIEMLSQLRYDNEKFIDILIQTAKEAEVQNQLATANLIQDLMETHGKFVWMLRVISR